MKRLLLIDGHSLAFRSFYGVPHQTFMTSSGQYTNAVHGFLSTLLKIIVLKEPTHVVAAFDLAAPTFRHEEYAEYKAGRSKTPPEFAGQIDLIREALDVLGIPNLTQKRIEADDIISILATTASSEFAEIYISSGDRDSFQLVNDHTTVLYPRTGGTIDLITPEKVFAKYGVTPEQYCDFAALVGEKADNLPGVPRVGPKTAAKWLQKYGNLENLYKNADSIGGKVGENLRSHEDDVRRNRKLNHLLRSGDLPLHLDDAEISTVDGPKLQELFDRLQFRQITQKIYEVFSVAGAVPKAPKYSPVTVQTTNDTQLSDWLAANNEPISIWAGAGITPHSDLTGICLGRADGGALWVDLSELSAKESTTLATWLAGTAPKIMHAGDALVRALAQHGYVCGPRKMDTEIAAYMLSSDQNNYNLADLALKELGMVLNSAESNSLPGLLLSADPAQIASAADGAVAIARLQPLLAKQLARISATQLFTNLEMPTQDVLIAMEERGIAIDRTRLNELEEEFTAAANSAMNDAHEVINDNTISLNSPKQLQEVLFERLYMPKTRKIKTGYTTNASALTWLYSRTEHPFLEALLRYREENKRAQIVTGLRKTIAEDGRIHTTFKQTAAATGRLSSKDPNLQNIPMRTTTGQRIRTAFIPGPDYDHLLSVDYSQIEMRVMVHLAQDPELIAAYEAGEDLHRYVGSKVFQVAPQDVSDAMRSQVKAMSYGLAYGLSAFGLAAQLDISQSAAEQLKDNFFERFGAVRDYLHQVVVDAREKGYTRTMAGRRRTNFGALHSPNRNIREAAERMALNSSIQGTAADIMKEAMLRVESALRSAQLRSQILLQVHDELVLEVPDHELAQVKKLVVSEMENAAELSVPLDVHVGYGPNWGETKS